MKLITVLVVDDSKIVRQILTNNLKKIFKDDSWQLDILEAENGLEAMVQMRETDNIDLILLDWNMPEMTGDQVVIEVRKNKEWNSTRILMATTEGSKKSVLAMLKQGANGYLIKPFQPDSIKSSIERLTQRMKFREV